MEKISVVEGNAFFLLMKIVKRAKTLTDQQTDIDFNNVQDLAVVFRRGLARKVYDVACQVSGDNSTIMVAKCEGLPVGTYSIEASGTYNGQKICVREKDLVQIVYSNEGSNTPMRMYEGESGDWYDLVIQFADTYAWQDETGGEDTPDVPDTPSEPDTPDTYETIYGDIGIILLYEDVEASGGTAMPNLSYSQTVTVLKNGEEYSEQILTTGATVTYDSNNGIVTVPASTLTSRHQVATMGVTVEMNGKTATATARIYQSAYIEAVTYDYYIGEIVATRSQFSALADEEIINSVSKITISGNVSKSFTSKKNCFVMLLPDTLSLSSASYTSGGLTTNMTASWNLTHDNIVIDGISYKVYGYRMNSVTEESPQVYVYRINIK